MIRGMVKVKLLFRTGGFLQLVRFHIVRDCLFLFLQHGAYSKAYDTYIDLLNERHKGECLLVVLCGLLSTESPCGHRGVCSWQ